jgi:hypothetical protein
MLSCYELRIGNYVLVDETVHRISLISGTTVLSADINESDEHNATEHNLDSIQPVLLTDEVLKQCGFVYHDYFKFWQLITTGIRSELDVDTDYNVIDFMRKPFIPKLTSLHQLQNSYFMMKGRELAYHQEAVSTN